MNCIPEKENLLLAYRDKFASIKLTYPEWSDTELRLQTAADLRPQFRLNRDAGYRENLGLSEYEVPEAAFTFTEDGSVWYTKYGQGLLEFHKRQLRLTPDVYSPEEHAISLLIEEHFKQGATSVVTSYGDRDLIVMHFDPITKLGTTKIIDVTKLQSTVQEIAKKRYAHFESLHLTDSIFIFSDKKLSEHHAREVIEPIIKQRMKTPLTVENIQPFASLHHKPEGEYKHLQQHQRVFDYVDDSVRQERQIRPEIHTSVAQKQLERTYVAEPEKIKPFTYFPMTPVYDYDEQPYGWFGQKNIWNRSVKPWMPDVDDGPKLQQKILQQQDNSLRDRLPLIDRQLVMQQIKGEKHIQNIEQVLREPDGRNDNDRKPFIATKVIFRHPQLQDPQPIPERIAVQREEKEEFQHEISKPPPIMLPLATCMTMFDEEAIPVYEQIIVLSMIPDSRQEQREAMLSQYSSVADSPSTVVFHDIQQKEEGQEVVEEKVQETTKEKTVYEVDEVLIQDVYTVTKTVGEQIAHGESPFCTVKKLLWMIQRDHDEELVPIEEVEITQNPNRTIQNLLHFLRKVVQKYVGDDVIRKRIVQRIASDKWDNEVGEIEEYLIFLKTHRMYNHLFAVVN